MLITIATAIIILTVIVFIFSSKTLSPIPYFPSNKKDMKLIIKALNLKNGQTVIDLGAGDGIVIFEAARSSKLKNLDTYFIAVEINPVLIAILHLKRLFHSNKRNIRIVRNDMFKMDFSGFPPEKSVTFYLYISPWHIEKTLKNIQRQISSFSIVSYMYPIKSLTKKEKIFKGRNKLFFYS